MRRDTIFVDLLGIDGCITPRNTLGKEGLSYWLHNGSDARGDWRAVAVLGDGFASVVGYAIPRHGGELAGVFFGDADRG